MARAAFRRASGARLRSDGDTFPRETERDRLKERLAECEKKVDHHRREMEDWLSRCEELRYLLGVAA